MSLSGAQLELSQRVDTATTLAPTRQSADIRRVALVGSVGFAASIVIALTASHVGGPFPSTTHAWWFAFKLVPGSPTLDTALMVAGFYGALVALGACWLAVLRITRRQPLRVPVVAGLSVLWALPFFAAPPLMSTDLYAYATTGHLMLAGHNPYTWAPKLLPASDPFRIATDVTALKTVSLYGPVFTRLSEFAAVLGQGGLIATVLWERLIAVAGLVVIAVAGVPLARRAQRHPSEALALVMLSPFTLVNFVGGGHNDALMVGLMLSGVALVVVKRWWIPGIALCGAAQAVKTPALLSVGFLGWAWPGISARLWQRVRWTVLAVVVGVAALAVVGLAARLGWGWLVVRAPWDSPWAPVTKVGYALGRLTGNTPAALQFAKVTGIVVSALITVVLLVRSRDFLHERLMRGAVVALAMSLLAIALLSPAFHYWYLLWGIALVAFATSSKRVVWMVVLLSAVGLINLPSG